MMRNTTPQHQLHTEAQPVVRASLWERTKLAAQSAADAIKANIRTAVGALGIVGALGAAPAMAAQPGQYVSVKAGQTPIAWAQEHFEVNAYNPGPQTMAIVDTNQQLVMELTPEGIRRFDRSNFRPDRQYTVMVTRSQLVASAATTEEVVVTPRGNAAAASRPAAFDVRPAAIRPGMAPSTAAIQAADIPLPSLAISPRSRTNTVPVQRTALQQPADTPADTGVVPQSRAIALADSAEQPNEADLAMLAEALAGYTVAAPGNTARHIAGMLDAPLEAIVNIDTGAALQPTEAPAVGTRFAAVPATVRHLLGTPLAGSMLAALAGTHAIEATDEIGVAPRERTDAAMAQRMGQLRKEIQQARAAARAAGNSLGDEAAGRFLAAMDNGMVETIMQARIHPKLAQIFASRGVDPRALAATTAMAENASVSVADAVYHAHTAYHAWQKAKERAAAGTGKHGDVRGLEAIYREATRTIKRILTDGEGATGNFHVKDGHARLAASIAQQLGIDMPLRLANKETVDRGVGMIITASRAMSKEDITRVLRALDSRLDDELSLQMTLLVQADAIRNSKERPVQTALYTHHIGRGGAQDTVRAMLDYNKSDIGDLVMAAKYDSNIQLPAELQRLAGITTTLHTRDGVRKVPVLDVVTSSQELREPTYHQLVGKLNPVATRTPADEKNEAISAAQRAAAEVQQAQAIAALAHKIEQRSGGTCVTADVAAAIAKRVAGKQLTPAEAKMIEWMTADEQQTFTTAAGRLQAAANNDAHTHRPLPTQPTDTMQQLILLNNERRRRVMEQTLAALNGDADDNYDPNYYRIAA